VLVAYHAPDGESDGVAIVDADPASPRFGEVRARYALGVGAAPREVFVQGDTAWVTAEGPLPLLRLGLSAGLDGAPRFTEGIPVDVGANRGAADIWFAPDGEAAVVTFQGGHGDARDGSVARFDAAANGARTAEVRHDEAGAPLLWPHGIAGDARRGQLLVTTFEAPPPYTGVGDTVTSLDPRSLAPLQHWSFEAGSAPVDIVLPGGALPPYALVATLYGGDIWAAPFEPARGTYGAFTLAVDGDDAGVGLPRGLRVQAAHDGEQELYVPYADPGVVHVYGLDSLPDLPLRRTLPAAPGAHHLTFLRADGRLLAVVQSDGVALDGADAGALTVLDVASGEVLATLDLPATEGIAPVSVTAAFDAPQPLRP